MKILYVTTIGGTMNFFCSLIKELIKDGHTVDIATNEVTRNVNPIYRELGCKIFQVPFSRSPIKKENLEAIKMLRDVVEENDYEIVHCHTPVASVCTRIACRQLRKEKGVKVFYTAHGFHFYKGAPLKNWLVFYPVEKICSYWTDVLITINEEDFELAKRRMKAKKIEYVHGVGIDLQKFENTQVDREKKRREIGIPENAFLLTSVGELIARKNHKVILEALAKIEDENIHYMIVGSGALHSELEALANERGIEQRVHFLGYRNDVAEIYKVSDVCCLPSIHEGLPVALMEAMACGLPCIASRIRGNVDLIDEKAGFLVEEMNIEEYAKAILTLAKNVEARLDMGNENKNRVIDYSITTIIKDMKSIYES